MKIKELELIERHAKTTLKQLFRKENWAIYARLDKEGKEIGYELIKIKVSELYPKFQQKLIDEGYTHYESYPSSEQFGKLGWDFVRYSDAYAWHKKMMP